MVTDTANVADVLDAMGLPNQALSTRFRPLSGTRIGGWVFTLHGSDVDVRPGKDALKFEALSHVGPDEVTVWAGSESGACFLGELIAVGLAERGCVGALVHGGTRDLRWLDRHRFPVFGTYRSPLQSAGRWSVRAYQVDVRLPGATGEEVVVSPGDFVLGDEDGCVVVPAAAVEHVLVETERLTRHEIDIRRALADGMSLAECLETYGKV